MIDTLCINIFTKYIFFIFNKVHRNKSLKHFNNFFLDVVKCTIGVMTLQNVQYFQDTLYHIIGDVIVVTNQYAVSFIEYYIGL